MANRMAWFSNKMRRIACQIAANLLRQRNDADSLGQQIPTYSLWHQSVTDSRRRQIIHFRPIHVISSYICISSRLTVIFRFPSTHTFVFSLQRSINDDCLIINTNLSYSIYDVTVCLHLYMSRACNVPDFEWSEVDRRQVISRRNRLNSTLSHLNVTKLKYPTIYFCCSNVLFECQTCSSLQTRSKTIVLTIYSVTSFSDLHQSCQSFPWQTRLMQ